jgi:hypothetical protein
VVGDDDDKDEYARLQLCVGGGSRCSEMMTMIKMKVVTMIKMKDDKDEYVRLGVGSGVCLGGMMTMTKM